MNWDDASRDELRERVAELHIEVDHLLGMKAELLEACKALVAAWNAPTGYGVTREMDRAEAMAKAAIAKAEGRS